MRQQVSPVAINLRFFSDLESSSEFLTASFPKLTALTSAQELNAEPIFDFEALRMTLLVLR